MRTSIRAMLFIVLMVASTVAAVAAPAVGDTYVYRVTNAYNNEVQGQVTYRVDKVDAGQVTLSATPDRPALGTPHTDILASDANWLRHPLINHDMPVEYTFSPPFPAMWRRSTPENRGRPASMRPIRPRAAVPACASTATS